MKHFANGISETVGLSLRAKAHICILHMHSLYDTINHTSQRRLKGPADIIEAVATTSDNNGPSEVQEEVELIMSVTLPQLRVRMRIHRLGL